MSETEIKPINHLDELQAVASDLISELNSGDVIYLTGELGAGKTTFAQYLLSEGGVKEHVKSPTYNLYETYQTASLCYIHMDLYRLTDPEELYFLGIEELVDGHNVLLVEWPEKGLGVMPKPDWLLEFELKNLNRTLTITSKK